MQFPPEPETTTEAKLRPLERLWHQPRVSLPNPGTDRSKGGAIGATDSEFPGHPTGTEPQYADDG